jgi:plastocyanin
LSLKRVTKSALAVACLAAAFTIAACGGDGGEATPDPDIPAGAPFIDQDNLEFRPDELTVSAGETVYFQNSETAIHTVTIEGENESGNMERGDVFAWTPPGPGEYRITCDFHPQMRATITVE